MDLPKKDEKAKAEKSKSTDAKAAKSKQEGAKQAAAKPNHKSEHSSVNKESGDGFGFPKNDKEKKETKAADAEEAKKPTDDKKSTSKGAPKSLGESDEHRAMENADVENIWINGKPVDVQAMHAKQHKQKVALQKAAAKAALTPEKEVAAKKTAQNLADDLHIWVNGQPHVSKTAAKQKQEVVKSMSKPEIAAEQAPAVEETKAKPTPALGESAEVQAEGIEQMRSMKLVATRNQDTSDNKDMQGKIPSHTEYNFSIRNTDKGDKSMGIAKNVHLQLAFPKSAKLQDAYFYLEAEGKEDPQSMNCKLNQDDAPTVNCMVPKIKDLVDVYVRTHYDGDQESLSKLTGDDAESSVVGTLHEGHEVLTTTQLPALAKTKLLKRMHHD